MDQKPRKPTRTLGFSAMLWLSACGCSQPPPSPAVLTARRILISDTQMQARPDFPTISLLRIETVDSTKVVWFEFRNPTDNRFAYAGYGAQRPYRRVARRSSQGWIEDDADWCGTGLESHELYKGQPVHFAEVSDGDPRWLRVAVWVRRVEDNVQREVWSDEVVIDPGQWP